MNVLFGKCLTGAQLTFFLPPLDTHVLIRIDKVEWDYWKLVKMIYTFLKTNHKLAKRSGEGTWGKIKGPNHEVGIYKRNILRKKEKKSLSTKIKVRYARKKESFWLRKKKKTTKKKVKNTIWPTLSTKKESQFKDHIYIYIFFI